MSGPVALVRFDGARSAWQRPFYLAEESGGPALGAPLEDGHVGFRAFPTGAAAAAYALEHGRQPIDDTPGQWAQEGSRPPDSQAPLFKWSTPAPAPDGTRPAPWRVADANAARALLEALGYNLAPLMTERTAYVEHDGQGLHVGLRDNRISADHGARLRALADVLREHGERLGFRVRLVEGQGVAFGLHLSDRASERPPTAA